MGSAALNHASGSMLNAAIQVSKWNLVFMAFAEDEIVFPATVHLVFIPGLLMHESDQISGSASSVVIFGSGMLKGCAAVGRRIRVSLDQAPALLEMADPFA